VRAISAGNRNAFEISGACSNRGAGAGTNSPEQAHLAAISNLCHRASRSNDQTTIDRAYALLQQVPLQRAALHQHAVGLATNSSGPVP
jgi:hypothetical protein